MLYPFAALLSVAALAQAQNSSTSSAASSTAAATSSASSGNGGAQVDTSLLPVPTRTGVAYSTATASALSQYLPGYTYNLTSEPAGTREGICAQTTKYCASAKCTDPTGNVTTNFCNPTTMGWNCQCDKGESRLQPVAVPVNSYDCQFRTQACETACQNRNSTVVVNNIQNCLTACQYIIGSTCGTSAQIIPEYQVKSQNDKPKYYPDTSKGGVSGMRSLATDLAVPGLATLAVLLSSVAVVLVGQ